MVKLLFKTIVELFKLTFKNKNMKNNIKVGDLILITSTRYKGISSIVKHITLSGSIIVDIDPGLEILLFPWECKKLSDVYYGGNQKAPENLTFEVPEVNLTLTLEDAKRLYKTASSEFKEMLELNFGKDKLSDDITEIIKNFRHVIRYIQIYNEQLHDTYELLLYNNTNKRSLAAIKLQMIEFCLNEGEIPELGEERYCPIFEIKNESLVYSHTSCTYISFECAVTFFKNQKLAKYAGNTFLSIYQDLVE